MKKDKLAVNRHLPPEAEPAEQNAGGTGKVGQRHSPAIGSAPQQFHKSKPSQRRTCNRGGSTQKSAKKALTKTNDQKEFYFDEDKFYAEGMLQLDPASWVTDSPDPQLVGKIDRLRRLCLKPLKRKG
jgi:hypothetical protein